MATIREVAEIAEVSVATVSRVINKTGYVSPDLQQRVYQAMQALNYQPSALAQSLRSQRTQAVGVLVPQLDQPFFSSLTYIIEQALFARDYRTLVCSAEESQQKEAAYIDMLLRQRVDGVIIVPTGRSVEDVRRLLARQTPVVIVDRDLSALLNVNRVLIDNFQGAYDAMNHLLALGHRHIAIIAAHAYSQPMLERIQGAKQAMRDAGLEPINEVRANEDLRQFELGYATARDLLEREPRPTAIFALNDVIAVGAIHAAGRLGLNVPKDVSVMGFDNIPLSAYIIPELSTVAQPIQMMSEIATQLLLRQMQDPTTPGRTTLLKAELMLRHSTMPPRS
jgi:LacI family transcriptional regulator